MSEPTHILVVDDNATNRKLVAALLAHEGYRVSQAGDGAEGLAVAQRDPPQLIISDILMPSMDGYEFVRRLRADTAMRAVRVIFYTANYHEREARSLASQVGVTQVIVKPCATPALLQAIAEVLAGTATATAPPAQEPGFDVEHLRLLTDKLSESANALRATNSRLAALTRVNLQMASEHDPRTLLQSVCRHARTLMVARFAVLAVFDKPQQDALITFVSGLPQQTISGIRDPRDDAGVLGTVFRERVAQRLVSHGTPVDLGLPATLPPVCSALIVPVNSLHRSHGWLCLCDKVGAESFSIEDERLLAILGAQLGRIYENGSLYREVQEHAAQLMVEIEERIRTTTQLRDSEERFRELAENIQDVFFVAGPDLAQTTYISPGYERVWGRPVEPMLDRAGAWMETVHPEDRARVELELEQILRGFPADGHTEFRILRPDGATRWVLTRFFPVVDEDGAVMRTVGVTSDMTERKLAELRVMRLNRTHSVLSGINSLIVRATDRDALLQDACDLAVQKGGFRVAWCALLDKHTNEISARAHAGDAEELAAAAHGRLDGYDSGESPVIDAVRSRQPRVCNDLTRDDVRSLYRDVYLQKGYRSLAALPLVVSGEAVGCLVLLTDSTDYFDEEEMRLLVELADDIAFALDHIGKAERLTYLASFDPLTGLANRREFAQQVTRYAAMATHAGARFAVVVVDIENFEALNNTLGRSAGDALLRQAGDRFAKAAGGRDVVGHLGGDQFAAIIHGSGVDSDVSRLVSGLRRDWLHLPFEIDGKAIELSAKTGVALFPADGHTGDALLTNATAALRNAKQVGNTGGFYTRDMSERIAERLALENALRRALENREYELHYQPKVDLAQRRTTGLEALIRWRRPAHGLVAPDAFVPLLEETGLIVDVGAWVMRQACLDRKRWVDMGLDAPRVAVNVSAVQLRRDDFVPTVGQILKAAGNDAGLDVEVTESVLMDDVSQNLIKLQALRDFGVGIALDDFGTGYSSLAYLAKLPVGVLKIDRSFVSSIEDQSVVTLVSTIISLARSLRLETVAEGVETEEQAKILRLLGCDQMQGYLISRPVAFQEMTALLQKERG